MSSGFTRETRPPEGEERGRGVRLAIVDVSFDGWVNVLAGTYIVTRAKVRDRYYLF